MKYSPTEEEVTERAIENATNNLTTTDIWDAFNSAGLGDFESLLAMFKSGEVLNFGNKCMDIIDSFILEELADKNKAYDQLLDEYTDRSE
jgi:hypothetical protein